MGPRQASNISSDSVSLVLGLQALPPHLGRVKLSCPPLQSLESRFRRAEEVEDASLPNSPWSPT